MRNPFEEELIYLSGGERREVEIASFPHLGKHLIRIGKEAKLVDSRQLQTFWRSDDE